MKNLLLYSLAFFIGSILLISCNNEQSRVYIDYEQIGNFQTYKTNPNGSSTGPGQGYFHALFKIKRIRNTSSKAKTFAFTHDKVLALADNGLSKESLNKPTLEQLLGNGLAYNVTVKPGETKTNVGCIIKRVKALNASSFMNNTGLVSLLGQKNPQQPITCTRLEGNNVVLKIFNPATPARLQDQCGKAAP